LLLFNGSVFRSVRGLYINMRKWTLGESSSQGRLIALFPAPPSEVPLVRRIVSAPSVTRTVARLVLKTDAP
jgi:hypothetical protein